MTDKLTTDELVKLAEFCGKENIRRHDDGFCVSDWPVFVDKSTPQGRVRIKWRPDKDANQRDEVVEKLRQKGSNVIVVSHAELPTPFFSCYVAPKKGDPIAYRTPGDAVCRAALKVIEEKPNAD